MKRVDDNHKGIVEGLRQLGATVQSLAECGHGVPDLLCGHRGRNFLFEVKNPDMPPSKRKMTPDEEKWHQRWNGTVHIVESLEDAICILTGHSRRKERT